MDFKMWLESDEMHPFEKWHQEYKAALDRERKRNRTPYWTGIPKKTETGPGTAADLLKDQRSKYVYVTEVIEVDGYSNGVHGWGDQPDIPAGDPFYSADVKVKIDAKTEKKLAGRTALVIDKSGGSFHERWAKMYVYVIVNDIVDDEYYTYDTPDDDRIDYSSLPSTEFKHIVKFFKFQSVKNAAEIIEELEPNISFPVLPGEDREAYWNRVIKSVGPQTDPDGYNSRDDYFKR